MYTTRRERLSNHLNSAILVGTFAQEKARAVQLCCILLIFFNLNLYKLYNKYFCLTIIYMKETSTPFLFNPTLCWLTAHCGLIAEIPSRIRDRLGVKKSVMSANWPKSQIGWPCYLVVLCSMRPSTDALYQPISKGIPLEEGVCCSKQNISAILNVKCTYRRISLEGRRIGEIYI